MWLSTFSPLCKLWTLICIMCCGQKLFTSCHFCIGAKNKLVLFEAYLKNMCVHFRLFIYKPNQCNRTSPSFSFKLLIWLGWSEALVHHPPILHIVCVSFTETFGLRLCGGMQSIVEIMQKYCCTRVLFKTQPTKPLFCPHILSHYINHTYIKVKGECRGRSLWERLQRIRSKQWG